MIFYTITGTMPVKPDWSGISGILKAGTPISVRGAISNDDGAVGLVAADTAHGAEAVLAVIAGVVDLAEASASYGSAISDDVVQALDNVAFIYGGKVYGVSGSSLPDYSEASDGDVLAIEDGAPAWTTPSGGGGGVLVVTFGGDYGLTPDKTTAEIAAAASAGQLVVFKWSREGGVFVGIADITLSNGSMTAATASAVNDMYDGMLSAMKYGSGSWSSLEKYL